MVKSIVEWMGHGWPSSNFHMGIGGCTGDCWRFFMFFRQKSMGKKCHCHVRLFWRVQNAKKNQKIAEVFLGIRALVILESFLVFLSPFFLSVFLSFFLASFFLPWKHNTSQHHDDAGSSSAFFWWCRWHEEESNESNDISRYPLVI